MRSPWGCSLKALEGGRLIDAVPAKPLIENYVLGHKATLVCFANRFASAITREATKEVKLDGYRAIGVKSSRESTLYSRNHKNFNKRFPQIAEALGDLSRYSGLLSRYA